MTPHSLGHYRLLERLGEGGMGAVYRAVDEMLDREVAVKVLKPEVARQPGTLARFRFEAVTLAKLDHPGIARVIELSQHEERWFIVMEYVQGETLLSRLQRLGRLPWPLVQRLAVELLEALDYAHRRGVVHRDIKPANLILTPDERLKVTDFGIARVLGTAGTTRTGHVVGTLEYMAPEQICSRDVDGRTDLYGVGIVLYELLTGQVPFRGVNDYEIITQHLEAMPAPLPPLHPPVPPWADEVLQRALAKQPDQRFATATQFRAALQGSAASASEGKATRLATALPFPVSAAAPPTRMADAREFSAGAASSSAVLPGAAAFPRPSARESAPGPFAALQQLTAAQWASIAAVALLLLSLPFALRFLLSPREAATLPVATTQVTTVAPAPGGGALVPPQPTAAATPSAVEYPQDLRSLPLPPLDDDTVADHNEPPGGRSSPREGLPPGTSGPRPIPAERGAPADPPPPVVVTAERHDPPPATRTALATMEFENIRVLDTAGEKPRELDAIILLDAARIVIKDEDGEATLRTFPYARIRAATYSRSRRPVWKTEEGNKVGRVISAPFSFIKTTRHWLTLEGGGESLVLRLDNNFAEILAALEKRTDVSIARETDKEP